jgi:hypothetical protein
MTLIKIYRKISIRVKFVRHDFSRTTNKMKKKIRQCEIGAQVVNKNHGEIFPR